MPIRVLATFPAIPGDPPISDDHPISSAAALPPDAPQPAVASPAGTAGLLLRPAVSPAGRPPRRIRPRDSFPGASVAALAVVAAAIWSLIAIREAKRPAAHERDVRIATEAATAHAAEAILR